MKTVISTNAPGLPSRRGALTALAGIGAALSLPKAARATPLAADHPDAALIAHAAMVEEMVARSNEAWAQQSKLEGQFDNLKPPRPQKAEMSDTIETVERGPDGGVLSIVFRPVDPALAAARKQHEAAVAEWQAACDALSDELGVDAGEELTTDLYDALADAVGDLTPMVPKTLVGLAAKARIAVALDPKGCLGLNGWENALIASIARDAIMIGGAA